MDGPTYALAHIYPQMGTCTTEYPIFPPTPSPQPPHILAILKPLPVASKGARPVSAIGHRRHLTTVLGAGPVTSAKVDPDTAWFAGGLGQTLAGIHGP